VSSKDLYAISRFRGTLFFLLMQQTGLLKITKTREKIMIQFLKKYILFIFKNKNRKQKNKTEIDAQQNDEIYPLF
jgi:hypothetical protein